MSDHSKALVPLETWAYASPELRSFGRGVDIGLFSEALIYYDTIAVNITNQPQLSEFLRWFIDRGVFEDLLALLHDGTVQLYDYSFATAAVRIGQTGEYTIMNIQDPVQAEPNTFERRFLYHKEIEALFPKPRYRTRVYEAFRGRVIEVKANEFGSSVENARADHQDPKRNALLLQAFVDELYAFRKLGTPPEIAASTEHSTDGVKQRITWNVDFDELARFAGPRLNFHAGTVLTAGALANRFIWSAAQLSCDLFLGQPMGILVGDKLYEATQRAGRIGEIVEDLCAEVEFPDIRRLINEAKIDFKDVLRIRNKANRFRQWLQQESDRDRNAIIAYHNETARELGIATAARKTLSIFGVIAGAAAGWAIGNALVGPVGGALGGTVGFGTQYLLDVLARIGTNWRPVVFGNWFRDRIQNLIGGNK